MARKKKEQPVAKVEGSKLTVDMVVEHEKQYEEKATIVFNDGNYAEIYKKFNPSKIEQTIVEHSKFIDELRKRKIAMEDEKILKLYFLHIALNFSTLGESLPKDFDAKVKTINYLLNNECYVEKIFQSFDQKEVEKARDALLDKFKLVATKMDTDESFRKQVEDKLKEMAKDENNVSDSNGEL